MYLSDFSILHVEDDPDIQEIVQYILEPKVKHLYFASNGKNALQVYEQYKPDIVLSDINMPHMNGLEMSKQLKSKKPDLPIVLFSGCEDAEYFKEAINIGIDKYIQKPFANKTIYETLDNIAKSLYMEIEKKHIENMNFVNSKLNIVDETIKNISHQWRQPLSVISILASGVGLKIETGQDLKKEDILNYSNDILNQVEYLSSTIDKFKSLYTKTSIQHKSFNIKDAVNNAVNFIQDSYDKDNIEIILELLDYPIIQQEVLLVQVVVNILNNSKEAFESTNTKNRYVFVSSKIIDKKFVLYIKDTAGGVEADILNRVFEPYFTTRFGSRGKGNGLYMCNKIITESFKGEIFIYNEDIRYKDQNLKGTVVKIVL